MVKNIFLVSNDIFLCKGISFLSDFKLSVNYLTVEDFFRREVGLSNAILLDLNSWQSWNADFGYSLAEVIDFYPKVFLLTNGPFQRIVSGFLYPSQITVMRENILDFLYASRMINDRYDYDLSREKSKRIHITKREVEVTLEIFFGAKPSVLSDKLNVSVSTISAHKISTLSKLGCKSLNHLYILIQPFIFDLNLILNKIKR